MNVLLIIGIACCVIGIIGIAVTWWRLGSAFEMPGIEDVELPEHCQDCKEEFGHPDNCIGCPHENQRLTDPAYGD